MTDSKTPASGVSPSSNPHRPGLAPALGLRAGSNGLFILPQANLNKENVMSFIRWLRNLRSARPLGQADRNRRHAPLLRAASRFRPRLEALEDRCLMSAGALDTTFNPTGSPPGTVSADFRGEGAAEGVAVYPKAGTANDGKIVADGGYLLVRYNTDGSLDTSFNGTGMVVPGAEDYDVAIQSDGKIVAAGLVGGNGGDFLLARYTTAGALDNAFGTKGQVTTNFTRSGGSASHDVPYAIAVEADGKIVLAGQTNSAANPDIGLARYETNGNLDDGSKKDITPADSFGSGGLVITSHTLIAGVGAAAATDMVIDSAGRLVVVGYARLAGTSFSYEPFVARYNQNGSLDTSFGTTGTGIIPLPQFPDVAGNYTAPRAGVALQADGKIVLTWGTEVVRLNAAGGSLDTASFGSLNTDGSHTGYVTLAVGAGAVQVQSNGMIVVATSSASNFAEVGVTRLLSDGSFDTSFGTGGTTQMPPGYPEFTRDLAIQPDGAIVLAGIDGSFELARFLPAAPQIGSFTASPNPVTAGSMTLTAWSIIDLNPNSTVTQVAFYQDSNGDGILEPGTDTLLGYGTGTQTSPGVWTFTFTVNLAPGTYTLFARAEDNYGVSGDPLAITVTVS
jgi:uncharacterized delta-60 repeat protein